MNKKQEKYITRNKSKYYESEVSSEEEEENSRCEKGGLSKGKRKIRQRQENSLGELTKNFINYIKEQGGREININDVVKQLKVKKRRIYDITNVLEGIGYIKKLAKNKIQWLKDDLYKSDEDDEEGETSNNMMEEQEMIEKELNELTQEESNLDNWIDHIKTSFEKLTEDTTFKEYGYVTFDDIKALTVGEDINLIAIKAPAGTSLEIPDPDQIQSIYLQTLENMKNGRDEYDQSLLDSLEKKYQLFLDSPNGEINVFLVLNKMEDEKSELSSKNLNMMTNHLTNHSINMSGFNSMNHTLNQSLNPLHQFSNFNPINPNFSKNSPVSSNNNVLQPSKSYKNLPKNYSENEMINNFS